MTRLTNYIKEQVKANALVKSGYQARYDMQVQQRRAWAEAVRVDACGGSEAESKLRRISAEVKTLFEQIPKGLQGPLFSPVRLGRSFNLNLAGMRVVVRFAEKDEYPRINPCEHTIKEGNPLVQQFLDLEAEAESILEFFERVTTSVKATLDRFSTVEKLIREWPECRELLPMEAAPTPNKLPSILVADLNTLVGLPTPK